MPGHHASSDTDLVSPPVDRRIRSLLVLAVGVLVAATAAAVVVLWPTESPRVSGALGPTAERDSATVRQVGREPCGPSQGSEGPTCPVARVELTSGPRDSSVVTALLPEGEGAPVFEPGDRVVVAFIEVAPEGQQYQVVDFQRGHPMWILAAAFALLVLVTARWRGIAAIGGLAVSAFVLLEFVVPAVLSGESPVVVAVVGASCIMLASLFLVHGPTVRTAVAALGTAATLGLIGLLAYLVVEASRFTGLGTEDAAYLRTIYGEIDLGGLLLAGIVIGSLGVLDDMTVTQTSVVWELAAADPRASRRDVYRAAARVGRDHVASVVNTLVLAYAGASLPLLLLFTVSEAQSSDVITTEVIAQEVIRTLVGGIGVVAAAPLTTALAAAVAVSAGDRSRRRRRTPARAG